MIPCWLVLLYSEDILWTIQTLHNVILLLPTLNPFLSILPSSFLSSGSLLELYPKFNLATSLCIKVSAFFLRKLILWSCCIELIQGPLPRWRFSPHNYISEFSLCFWVHYNVKKITLVPFNLFISIKRKKFRKF